MNGENTFYKEMKNKKCDRQVVQQKGRGENEKDSTKEKEQSRTDRLNNQCHSIASTCTKRLMIFCIFNNRSKATMENSCKMSQLNGNRQMFERWFLIEKTKSDNVVSATLQFMRIIEHILLFVCNFVEFGQRIQRHSRREWVSSIRTIRWKETCELNQMMFKLSRIGKSFLCSSVRFFLNSCNAIGNRKTNLRPIWTIEVNEEKSICDLKRPN